MKKYLPALGMWLLFETVAVSLWLALGKVFYLLNFSYIGTALALGLALYAAGWRYARHVVQFAVGLYMLVYLGLICRENMQIDWKNIQNQYVNGGESLAKLANRLSIPQGQLKKKSAQEKWGEKRRATQSGDQPPAGGVSPEDSIARMTVMLLEKLMQAAQSNARE